MEQKSQETKMLEYEIAENEVKAAYLQIKLLNAKLADLHKFLAYKEANAEKLAVAAGLSHRIGKNNERTQSEKSGNEPNEPAREAPMGEAIDKTMEEPMEEPIQKLTQEPINQPIGKPIKETIEMPMKEKIEDSVKETVKKPMDQIVVEGAEPMEQSQAKENEDRPKGIVNAEEELVQNVGEKKNKEDPIINSEPAMDSSTHLDSSPNATTITSIPEPFESEEPSRQQQLEAPDFGNDHFENEHERSSQDINMDAEQSIDFVGEMNGTENSIEEQQVRADDSELQPEIPANPANTADDTLETHHNFHQTNALNSQNQHENPSKTAETAKNADESENHQLPEKENVDETQQGMAAAPEPILAEMAPAEEAKKESKKSNKRKTPAKPSRKSNGPQKKKAKKTVKSNDEEEEDELMDLDASDSEEKDKEYVISQPSTSTADDSIPAKSVNRGKKENSKKIKNTTKARRPSADPGARTVMMLRKKKEEKEFYNLKYMAKIWTMASKWYLRRSLEDELKTGSVTKEEREEIMEILKKYCPYIPLILPGERDISLDSTDYDEARHDKILPILRKVMQEEKRFDDKLAALANLSNEEKEMLQNLRIPTLRLCSALHFGLTDKTGQEIIDLAKAYIEKKENRVFESEFFNQVTAKYFGAKDQWYYNKKGFENSGKPIKEYLKKTSESKKDTEEPMEQVESKEEDKQEENPIATEKPMEENEDVEEYKSNEPEEPIQKSEAKVVEELVEVINVLKGFNQEDLKKLVISKDVCMIRGLQEACGINFSKFDLRLLEELRGENHYLEILRQKPQHNERNQKLAYGGKFDEMNYPNDWEMKSAEGIVTLKDFVENYEKVQAVVKKGLNTLLAKLRSNQEITQNDLEKIVRALMNCQIDLKTTKAEGRISHNFPIISFGTNLDLTETTKDQFKDQYKELKKLPHFLHFDKGLLAYVKAIIGGINCPQVYFKQPGSRTSAHIENQSLDSVNMNLGPGDCVWLTVSSEHAGRMEELMCHRGVWPYDTAFWPSEENLKKAEIPYKKFTQQTGDLVYVGTGTFHWVQSEGFTANVAWNIGQENYEQLASVFLVHDHNEEQKYETTLPIVPMIWEMARAKAFLGHELEPLIRSVLIRSLFVSQVEMETAKKAENVELNAITAEMEFHDVERCGRKHCKKTLFNMIVRETKTNGAKEEQLCMKCAEMNETAKCFYREDISQLVKILDEYRC